MEMYYALREENFAFLRGGGGGAAAGRGGRPRVEMAAAAAAAGRWTAAGGWAGGAVAANCSKHDGTLIEHLHLDAAVRATLRRGIAGGSGPW